MPHLFYIIAAAVFFGLLALIFLLFFALRREMDARFSQMIDSMGVNLQMISSQLNASNEHFSENFARSSFAVGDIQRKLGLIESTARTMQEIGKDVSSLQSILQSPKLRGNFGEYLLYQLLKDSLPRRNYEEQYHFSDGCAVDAVIRLGKNLVSVDSKFPLESFRRYNDTDNPDEKKRAKAEFIKSVRIQINEIAEKYIRPHEHTFDFALMYIPAEAVYYEILTNDWIQKYNLFDYAMKKRVIPVSPNTFYAYLMSIVYGLRGFRIEQRAEAIAKDISDVSAAFSGLSSDFAVLGKHIDNAVGKYTDLNRKITDVNIRLRKITEADEPE